MRAQSFLAAGLALALVLPAATTQANDTMAELKTGGLHFVRSDAVAMEQEDLFISMDEIRVDYVFYNSSDEDVRTIVAFPMPDITATMYGNIAVPGFAEDDVLDDDIFNFVVDVDGVRLEPELEMRAFSLNLDITDDLLAAGVPVNHLRRDIGEFLAALDEDTKTDWIARGILYHDYFDDPDYSVDEHWPLWTMRSTYWWWATFPAGQRIKVSHRYAPSVGGTVAATFLESDGRPGGYSLEEYQRRYCMDGPFLRALENATRQSGREFPPFFEAWISYVLTTGGNWAGPIGRFTLTVDKGAPENFISFCGEGVEKIGPTTFRMVKEDFFPERDLDFLIMRRHDY